MPRIEPVDRDTAPDATRQLLAGVEKKHGMVPNMIGTLGQSPAAAKAYLNFSQALSDGVISPQLREEIALTVSQINECEYCLAAHCAIGNSVGLSDEQLRDARLASSPDRKTEATLKFARAIVDNRGFVADADLADARTAGLTDEAIVEVVGHVALSIFTNYFNHVAEPEIDFPKAAALTAA